MVLLILGHYCLGVSGSIYADSVEIMGIVVFVLAQTCSHLDPSSGDSV